MQPPLKKQWKIFKRACAVGGVSVQGTPAQVETNNTPTVPFMFMNDRQERQPLKTVGFKEESSQDRVNESILKLTQMMERQFQLAEKQDNDSSSRGRRRDRRDNRDRRSRSYDRSSSYDRSKSRERSNSRDRSRDRSDRNDRSSRNKSRIKIQETRGTIQVQDIPQVCFVIIVK